MKNLIAAFTRTSLLTLIVIGIGIGVTFALIFPGNQVIPILGNVFVNALKSIAPVIVFFLVISSIANAAKQSSRRFSTVIFLYILSTLLAAIVAVAASYLFPLTLTMSKDVGSLSPPNGIGEVLESLFIRAVNNPVASLVEANYIGILLWAVLFGLALRSASAATKSILADLAEAAGQAVRWVIQFAPLGIMGLVYETVSTNGPAIFRDYGRLLAVLVGSMLVVVLFVTPLIAGLAMHANPYPLVFRCLRESGITAFFTRSSAANIPINMSLCQRLGLDKDLYSVSIPLGATINMDGAAITITIMTMAAANTLGIVVDVPTAILLSFLATLGACGASGVAGGSLLLIPLACSIFGIPNDVAMQVVGVGFVIGAVQDSCETALNSSGDVIFAAAAEAYECRKSGKPFTLNL